MTIGEIEDILLVISDRGNDERAAGAAFATLYRRYSKFLNAVVSGVLKDTGIYDEHFLNTVVNNTFYKLYENPLVFSFREGAPDDKGFKAWLSVVAKNELKQLLKEYFSQTISLEKVDTDSIADDDGISEEVCKNVNLKMLEDAMNLFSERDRQILRMLYLYHDEGKNTPSEVLNIICNIYNTTKPNIRKIKERCEKKIIEYFEKRTQLKPLKYVK